MDKKYEIGNFICRLRNEKGYTQKELGVLLGVTDKAVSKWENGAALPRREVLRHLAAILGCTQEELLQGRRNERTAQPGAVPCNTSAETGGFTGRPAGLSAEAKKARAVIWKSEVCVLMILALLVGVFGFQKGIWDGTGFFRAAAAEGKRVYSGRSGEAVTIAAEAAGGTLELRSGAGKKARLRFQSSKSGAAQTLAILSADGTPILNRTYLNGKEDQAAWQGGRVIAEHVWTADHWYPGLPDQTICRMALGLEQTRIGGRTADFCRGLLFAALGLLACCFMEALIKLDVLSLGLFYRNADKLRAGGLTVGMIAALGIVLFCCGLVLCGSVLFG